MMNGTEAGSRFPGIERSRISSSLVQRDEGVGGPRRRFGRDAKTGGRRLALRSGLAMPVESGRRQEVGEAWRTRILPGATIARDSGRCDGVPEMRCLSSPAAG